MQEYSSSSSFESRFVPFHALGAEQVLNKLRVDYTKNLDGTLVVWGDLKLTGKTVGKLPDLSNVVVHGKFDCSGCSLDSLEGAPRTVGDFDCSHNNLQSLRGGPQLVQGHYVCTDNDLTTLEGVPNVVFGDFRCEYNQLRSLDHGPVAVGGNYHCFCNALETLRGAPKKTDGDFQCQKNNLTSLEYAPEEVGGDFCCHKNNIQSAKFAPKRVRGYTASDNLDFEAQQQPAPGISPVEETVSPPPESPKSADPHKFSALLAKHNIHKIDTSLVKIKDATFDPNEGLLLLLENQRRLQLGKKPDGSEFISAPGAKGPLDRSDAAAIISLGKSRGWGDISIHGNDRDKSMLCIEAEKQGVKIINPPPPEVLAKYRLEIDAQTPNQPAPRRSGGLKM
ncbi:MAG: hypothetical protein ACAH83_13505 [Alphaproteobacteria bacterium]